VFAVTPRYEDFDWPTATRLRELAADEMLWRGTTSTRWSTSRHPISVARCSLQRVPPARTDLRSGLFT